MKNIKQKFLQFLSGVELFIRSFYRDPEFGEPIDLSLPTGPRIKSTCASNLAPDFNTWVQHVHTEILSKYK